jgi:hypothetical protein
MNWPYLHLALNHVPVLGSVFLLALLAVAVFRRSEELRRVSLWGVVALTLAAIPIKFTGDAAERAVQGMPGFDGHLIEHHEQSADQATTAIFLAGVTATAALIAARRGRPVPRWGVISVLVLLALTAALMARAANSGGQIRHPEIRTGWRYPKLPAE